MKKINKFVLVKHRKQILDLFQLGKKYDKETDPEKKELLKAEVIQKCDELKAKLKLAGYSDEEAQDFLGVSVDASPSEDDTEKTPISEADDTNIS